METGYLILTSTLVRKSVHQFKAVTKVIQYPLAINTVVHFLNNNMKHKILCNDIKGVQVRRYWPYRSKVCNDIKGVQLYMNITR